MNLQKNDFKIVSYLIASFFVLEIISILAFLWPQLNIIIFSMITLLAILLIIKKLEYGLMILVAELVVGSKGYLLYLYISDDKLLSLRLVLWSSFMLIFCISFIRQFWKTSWQAQYLLNIKEFTFKKNFLYLAFVILFGLISAFIYKQKLSDIFLDFNAWLYFLLLIPFIAIKPKLEKLMIIFLAAIIWLSLKTIILLGIFSHYNAEFSLFIYRWLRKTLVGEMTLLSGWNRVFIQSQIFVVIAYFFTFFNNLNFKSWLNYKQSYFWLNLMLASLFMSTIMISLSRSFWLATVITLILGLIYIGITFNSKMLLKSIIFIFLCLIISLLLIRLAIPFNAKQNFEMQFVDRVSDNNGAAVSSRWSLLPALIGEILTNPLTGQGFGATVTYLSQDPRVLEQNSSGEYTTYAFEWGYFDIWLKLGFIGLFIYLWLIYSMIKKAWNIVKIRNDVFFPAIIASLLFLVIVHMFTPYLNHPLGIGYIILASCLISKNKVY